MPTSSDSPPAQVPVLILRDEKGRLVRGYTSNNPAGTDPKSLSVQLRTAKQTELFAIADALIDIALARDTGAGASNRDRIAAAQLLFDRAYGKPKQELDVSVAPMAKGRIANGVENASDERLDELERMLSMLPGGNDMIDVDE